MKRAELMKWLGPKWTELKVNSIWFRKATAVNVMNMILNGAFYNTVKKTERIKVEMDFPSSSQEQKNHPGGDRGGKLSKGSRCHTTSAGPHYSWLVSPDSSSRKQTVSQQATGSTD
ncbi:unnamed protein product [Clavelina lepadiformis]|uniref:Uncharacterized protein n=1 Tax=Clavelina lepadiformis TaxID=159417 RepID=A0ABP0GIR4_CLALP